MATFAYRTTSGAGGGTVEAPDRAAAVRELMRRGVVPTEVESTVGGSTPESAAAGTVRFGHGGSLVFTRRVMGRGEMAALVRELATALTAGLPLVQALRTLAKSGRNQRQREML